MHAVVFVDIQASGKTTFYQQRFLKTHMRLSLDLLKTRNKEDQFLNLCLRTGQKFVIDNTNPTTKERLKYIEVAKAFKFRITAYYFHTDLISAIERNQNRTGKESISIIGIKATKKKLQLPTLQEGFDEVFIVQIVNDEFRIVAAPADYNTSTTPL